MGFRGEGFLPAIPAQASRKDKLPPTLVPLHSIVVACLLAISMIVAGCILWLGVPLVWSALMLLLVFLLLLTKQPALRRDVRRLALFGSPGFVAQAGVAAARHGVTVVFAASASAELGPALLRFLIDARGHRPGTILIELPDDAVALRQRLPRLVETEPARVLCTASPGQPGERYLDQPVTVVATAPLSPWQHRAKRALDLGVALPALILLGPLLLLIALAIRLESPGGALFRQRRIGRLGRPFIMFKFRSMVEGARTDGQATARDDPRVTRVGRWLRATSIDELPQLLNVALGEMSIVGPRPHIATHRVEGGVFAEVIAEYAARHRVNPGITGLAQISGMRGGIESYERARRSVALDLRYIEGWSLWRDIRIIARTLLTGMAGRDVF